MGYSLPELSLLLSLGSSYLVAHALPPLKGCPTTCTDNSNGTPDHPCGPGYDQCGTQFGSNAPQYHIMDKSCGENDPNFPLFDPTHNLYHHMYQDHLAMPQNGLGQGPVIGHAVSLDMVYWTHLPVAVWNDQSYDNVAIYTGSATIVNNVPTLVYPGLCNSKTWSNCATGTLFAIAVPSNLSDPFLTNWSKPLYNPIVENVQRDPSTAWRTAQGEYRFTNYEGKIYSSMDFVHWNEANGGPLFPTAECPDFFPLPPLCTGNGCSMATVKNTQVIPTHVHKQSSSGQDYYTLGVYTEGNINTTGTWTPLSTVPFLQPLDYSAVTGSGMHFYASKSFEDPVGYSNSGPRRIYYGWALVPPASSQTLARVTTYNPTLQQLIFNPLPELSKLREMPPLYSSSLVTLSSNSTYWLNGNWSNSQGNQSEVGLQFTLPSSTSSSPVVYFGINVLVGTNSNDPSTNTSMTIAFTFDPQAFTANVTIGSTSSLPDNSSYYMVGIDLPGGDYNVTNVNYTDPHICQAVCTADPHCFAYTYVVRPPLYASCCLKGTVPSPNPNPTCTSGAKPGHPIPGSAPVPVPLLPGDTDIDVRIFIDNTFLEIFIMEGRIAYTIPIDNNRINTTGTTGMSLFANTFQSNVSITVTDINVWHMDTIWVNSEEILEQYYHPESKV